MSSSQIFAIFAHWIWNCVYKFKTCIFYLLFALPLVTPDYHLRQPWLQTRYIKCLAVIMGPVPILSLCEQRNEIDTIYIRKNSFISKVRFWFRCLNVAYLGIFSVLMMYIVWRTSIRVIFFWLFSVMLLYSLRLHVQNKTWITINIE